MIFAMERGDRERALIAKAFGRLSQEKLLSASDYIKSWSKLIEELDEIETDIMFVKTYLADFIVSAIQHKCISRNQFAILEEKHRTESCRAVVENVQDQLGEERR